VNKTHAYIESFLRFPNPALAEMDAQYRTVERAQPEIGLQAGCFLSLLIEAMRVRHVLEFGTCLGYSTLFLGEAVRRSGGRLTSIESDAEFFRITRENVTRAGLEDFVNLVHGDASLIIEELPGPFDLILQDSAKPLYAQMLEPCIARLRPRGILAADDALFRPMGIRKEMADPVHEYLERVFGDPRLTTTILPIGDGLAISVKREETGE